MSTPPGIPIRQRRTSILEYGGPNSLNEFAGSYSRMTSHMENLIVGQDLNTLPRLSSDDNVSYGAVDEASLFYPSETNSVFNDDPEDRMLAYRNRLVSVTLRLSAKPEDVIGRSTAPQTVFNLINILVGVGLYSLSFGFRYSGLIWGIILLSLCGVVTDYAAILIGRCLKANPALLSYGDIARFCYGNSAFIGCVVSFLLDLIGAAVALIILFSESFHAFFPSVSTFTFSVVYCFVVLALSVLPLSVLAHLSFVGIVCTSGTVLVCIIAGLLKSSGQGSLITPSDIYLWPEDYRYLLVLLGIFLALFGGHAVFPELYRDMRHPAKFGKAITVAFSFTICLDMVCALIGYIMFGNDVDEILTNLIMTTKGYASWIPTTLCVFLGLVPLTKGPLIVRPVAQVLDQYYGVAHQPTHSPLRVINKAAVIFIAFVIANACSSFAQVMAVMGSLICFTICITLPFLFYYKMYYDKLSPLKRLFFEVSVAVSLILTVAGTYCAIIY